MTTFMIAAGDSLLIAREARSWHVERHLVGRSPEAIAASVGPPARLYGGTHGHGLWRSGDGGRTWEPAGAGVPHTVVTAVAVERGSSGGSSVVYAGTEPSTLWRSEDGGERWTALLTLLDLSSADSWSFPPKPETHHVRWIETDPCVSSRLYVAIEAGALVRSLDRGETWTDRVGGGPIDTHTAATHPGQEGRVYCAAGDGYFESDDAGRMWRRPMEGLRHGYLVGIAVDPGDPETVVVSAASGPYRAYSPGEARAYLYRKAGGGGFELLSEGLPEARGTVASRLATRPTAPGVFYAANNHGLFRSADGGREWEVMPIHWPAGAFDEGVEALAVIEE